MEIENIYPLQVYVREDTHLWIWENLEYFDRHSSRFSITKLTRYKHLQNFRMFEKNKWYVKRDNLTYVHVWNQLLKHYVQVHIKNSKVYIVNF